MKKIFAILSLLCYLHNSFITLGQANCDGCKRKALLVSFDNPHNSDYEQRLQAWRQCMTNILGNSQTIIPETDPAFQNAITKCAKLDPPDKNYCYPSIISTFLGEKLGNNNPCFKMYSSFYFNPNEHKAPEYIFKGSYEANIQGGRLVKMSDGKMKPIVARLIIQLFYNGTTPELVKEWVTENTTNEIPALKNKTKLPKNINEMLDDFERRPASCDIELPPIKDICNKGEVEIIISNLVDKQGRTSKPFNRILVTVQDGEILNGEKSDLGPEYRVFTITEGKVIVKYQPPMVLGSDFQDLLRVYNSCEILPAEKFPMAQTFSDVMLTEKQIPLVCSDYVAEVTLSQHWDYTKGDTRYEGSVQSTFIIQFQKMKMDHEGPVYMYEPVSASGNWSTTEKTYTLKPSCPTALVKELNGTGTYSMSELKECKLILQSFSTIDKRADEKLKQFGLTDWYDLMILSTEEGKLSGKRLGSKPECNWYEADGTSSLLSAHFRYKIKDLKIMSGTEQWSSAKKSDGIECSDLTDAIYGQPPLTPPADGKDCNYNIRWVITKTN